MNKTPILLGAALGLALLITACETDNASARIQEKPAVYAALKPWQRKYIDKGVIVAGFTPDMVYLSIGKATKVEAGGTPESPTETWIYRDYFPTTDAAGMKYRQTGESQNNAGRLESNGKGGMQAKGAGKGGAANISTTGGVQGGSGEPADLQSYTLTVTFKGGLVKTIRLDPN